ARAVATVDPRAVAVHTDPAPTGSIQAPTSAPAPTSPTHPSAHAPATSPRNSWPARVVSLVPAGALTRVTAELRDGQRVDAEITSRSVAELALAPGSPVTLVVKAAQVALYPRR
ncbi:TOBE domain-containing protein, partial [Dietzia kunjamensis]